MNKLKTLLLGAFLILGLTSCKATVNSTVFNVDYCFGVKTTSDGKNIVLQTYDLGLFYGLSFESERPLVAGDQLKIRYSGSIKKQTTYPMSIHLDGTLISYEFDYTHVDKMSSENIKDTKGYRETEYVIFEDGTYQKLDVYTGDVLYYSIDQQKSKGILYIAGFYAYNPR